jgi:Protein of unknown function (DUF3224)
MRLHILVIGLILVLSSSIHAQRAPMTQRASGTFDVTVTPQPADDSAGGPFSRLFLDKRFHGQLEGTSRGTMLGTMSTTVQGSGGYVALEQVTGTLEGRRGTFILQHNGTMQAGVPTMRVTVVPDSGTDELAGLTGTMTIVIEGAGHSYAFEYRLGE